MSPAGREEMREGVEKPGTELDKITREFSWKTQQGVEVPRKGLEHPSHQPATPCSPATSFSTAVLCVGLKHFRLLLFIMPFWLQHSSDCSLGC